MRYRYRNEEEMKDSGVNWIGKIPKKVTLTKIKYFQSFINGYAFKSDELKVDQKIPIIRIGDIKELGVDYKNALKIDKNVAENLEQYRIKKDDILIAMSGATVGKTTYVNKEDYALINQRVGIIRPKRINSKFLYFSVNNNKFKEEILLTSVGGAQENISSENIQNKYILNFKFEQQDKIAKFLDEKTAQFDSIISKKEALIQKLEEVKKSLISEVVTGKVKVVKTSDGYDLVERKKEEMKESGVEWLGDIPKEWETKAIRYLFQLRNERNKKEMKDVQILSLFTALGVKKQGEVVARGNKVYTVEDYKEVYPDDIVVNIILAWMGAIGVSYDRGVISPAYDIYKPIDAIVNSKFYHYLFRTGRFSGECYKKGRGIMEMRWRTYSDEFKSIIVPVISVEQQKLIVNFLDGRIEDIDNLINKTSQHINKLKEAKQSLISEAVTGKIEILD